LAQAPSQLALPAEQSPEPMGATAHFASYTLPGPQQQSGSFNAAFVYACPEPGRRDGDGRRVKSTINSVTTYFVGVHSEVTGSDEYNVACGNLSQGYQCRMIGQYNDYYVFFFAYTSDDGKTLKSLKNLLMKIDDHRASCIRE
jgi:hypothetical protein